MKLVSILLVMGISWAVSTRAYAQLMYLSTGTNSYLVNPGDTLALDISVVNTSGTLGAIGYSYALKADTAGIFTVVSRQLFVLDDFTSGNANTVYNVSSTGTVDLGATWNGSDFAGTGTMLLQTAQIEISTLAIPDFYTLTLFLASAGPGVDDTDFNTYFMNNPLTISVQVVPEPATVGLLLLGLSGLAFWPRRYCR